MASKSNIVTVEWIRPKRYEGFQEKIARSRIRGKVVEGQETRALWRGKLYRVKVVDEHGHEWDDKDDEPLNKQQAPSQSSPRSQPALPVAPMSAIPNLATAQSSAPTPLTVLPTPTVLSPPTMPSTPTVRPPPLPIARPPVLTAPIVPLPQLPVPLSVRFPTRTLPTAQPSPPTVQPPPTVLFPPMVSPPPIVPLPQLPVPLSVRFPTRTLPTAQPSPPTLSRPPTVLFPPMVSPPPTVPSPPTVPLPARPPVLTAPIVSRPPNVPLPQLPVPLSVRFPTRTLPTAQPSAPMPPVAQTPATLPFLDLVPIPLVARPPISFPPIVSPTASPRSPTPPPPFPNFLPIRPLSQPIRPLSLPVGPSPVTHHLVRTPAPAIHETLAACRTTLFRTDQTSSPEAISLIERLQEQVHRLDTLVERHELHIGRLENRMAVLEAERSGPTKRAKPQCTFQDGQAVLGTDPANTFRVPADKYSTIFMKSATAKDLVVKLMPLVLSVELMAVSNFHGGLVHTGTTWLRKSALQDYPPFQAICSHAAMEFPGAFVTRAEQCALREVVNGKCRKMAQKQRLMVGH